MGETDSILGEVSTRDPLPNALFLALNKLKEEGQFREIIQGCPKALSVYPDDIRLRSLLAESYFETGLVDQAEAESEKVTSMIGGLIPAYKLQGKIYIKQQKLKEAHEALKRYLAHNPGDQEALDLLDRIISPEEKTMSKAPKALEDITLAEEEAEITDLATPTLAEIYYEQGQIREAISTYEKVLSNKPDDEASMQRVSELKALLAEEPDTQIAAKAWVRAKKERTIAILERWLVRLEELGYV